MEESSESYKLKVANELYQKRQDIVNIFQHHSETKDRLGMQRDTNELVLYIKIAELFPTEPSQLNAKKSWLQQESFEKGIAVAKMTENEKDYCWVVNYKDCNIYKAQIYDPEMYFDRPNELLVEIPSVIGSFIDRLTKNLVESE